MLPVHRCVIVACLAALSLLAASTSRRDVVHGQADAFVPVLVQLRATAPGRAFDAARPPRMIASERNAWRGARDRARLRDNERRATSPRARVAAAIAALGGTVTRHIHALPSLAARLPAGAIDELRRHADVVIVAADRQRHPRLSVAVPSILTSAFTTAGFTGSSIDVAVVDTGIYALNTLVDPGPASRLVNIISLASGCAPPDDDSSADDFQGHGTSIAGVIAGIDPTGDIDGIAPGIRKLVNVKAACATDSGVTQQDSDVIGGVESALALGADAPEVINYSFGTIGLPNAPNPDPYDNELLARYLDAVADAHGKVITVPAGSNGPSLGTIDTPGIAYNVITVGAVSLGTPRDANRNNDVVLSESARGPTAVSNRKKPDVVAPGVAVESASNLGGSASTSSNLAMGTSISSAFVAGLAALVLDAGVGDASVDASDDATAAKALIINSADDVDASTTEWSSASGWGYVNGATAYAQRAAVAAFTVAGSGTAATYFYRSTASASKATLVWTRDVTTSTTNPVAAPLENLDLTLYNGTTGAQLDHSTSLVDNVEQVSFGTTPLPAVLRVDGVGFTGGETQRAALAHSGGFVRSSLPSPSVSVTAPSPVAPLTSFVVTAQVTNASPIGGLPTLPLTSTTATIVVPTGYVVNGAASKPVAAAGPGGNALVTWTVVAPATATTEQPITVSTASTGYGLTFNASSAANVAVSASCGFAVQPGSIAVPSTGGTTNVAVTTSCAWTPVSNAPSWLTVPDAQRTGSGTLTITHAANTSVGDRTGTIAIGDTTVTVTQRSAPRSYYLAEGATGAFFDLDIVIANPNSESVPVVMTFLDAAGNTHPLNFTLAARQSRTVAVESEVPALASADVSTIVTSPSGLPLVVERSLFWDATYYGGHTGNAVDGPKTTWYFGEGFQSTPVFDTFILLANANPVPATVTLTFLRQGGTPVTITKDVGATSRANFWAAELPGELNGRSFSTVVTSTIPIIAERAMYFGTPFFSGGHESAGVSAPATNWFHPEGRTGPFFDTYILIGNPGAIDAHVTVRFLRANDSPITTTLTVGAQSRETVYVDAIPGLPDNDVSTEVTSDVPVISERAMYWPGDYAQWYEAHNSFGVTTTGVAWGLAEGRFGFAQGFETYILLTNPTSTPTRLRVTFLRQDGRPAIIDETQVLGANSRANVDMSALLTSPDYNASGERFGTIIESLDNVGIAVERALYFSTGGVFWSGGTNATAVKIR